MSELQAVSQGMAEVVKTVNSSIVRIDARKRVPATGVVWSTEGVIVTSHHVVRRDENISVGLADGTTVGATLVGRDPTTDVAVLQLNDGELTTPTWQSFADDAVGVGQLVLALGRPHRTVQASLGIVSALDGNWRTPSGGQVDHYLQPDLVMYPGFSGGPLVSANGTVLGINTSAILRGNPITIPTPTISRVVDALLAHGKIQRGYLGVSTQPVRLPANLAEALGQKTGLLLASVEPNSPAEKGGLLLGDTVVGLNETVIRHHDDLLAYLNGGRIGAKVVVKIIRGGQHQEVGVVVGERT
ncbi:trypsin-like peptidase domain-containing protein [Anaerolineales bacterium HSG6]|nr:trypsin-like peptidase domain-containing protein [Anaerolineales bacterium HSG6]